VPDEAIQGLTQAAGPVPKVEVVPAAPSVLLPLIVGIGASAGGLEAFRTFFTHMPADTGMAFVLVQHLAPDHKSMLVDLLSASTKMPVIEAADGLEIQANRVFVIPPNATLTVQAGRLRLEQPAPPRISRRPIDTFFVSLAEDQRENAVCVILSGTGSDGTLGAAAIKEHGGLTLAQAEFDHHAKPGMPLSATSTGQVDEILPVEAMPAKLVAYLKHLRGVAETKDPEGTRQDAGGYLATICSLLQARCGHDFQSYKEKTFVRRIQRRMQVLQIGTPEAYVAHLRAQPQELDVLFLELLIGVTQFFRDPAAFEALETSVLTSLVQGKGADDLIRIWVPGCATGQEVFTLAMLLREAMDKRGPRPKVQIFGTDIDERSIVVARLGRYAKPMVGVSPERLERWFVEDGDGYCIVPEIREMCLFSLHSLIKDPPFSKLDLISCRNLLIYLDPEAQDRVMRTFHYALNPGASLFLGSSEAVTRSAKLFGVADKKHRIFTRKAIEGPSLPDLLPARLSKPVPAPGAVGSGPSERIDGDARRLMEKYSPPHIVVDRDHLIVRFSGGDVGAYLEPSAGAPSFNLFNILRKNLRPAVRAALQEAELSGRPVLNENIAVRLEGKARLITLIVEPMPDHGAKTSRKTGVFVLGFQDNGPASISRRDRKTNDAPADAMQALEQELRTTKFQLQSSIDEAEVVNEEMRSSNEEYQSVNEELQSANEELETAKEEIQSVNEELHTINTEMGSKNELLTTLNSDLVNLLDSTEIATIFLDDQLLIKSFTPGITDIFPLRESDVGRPITEIVTLLSYADLKRDVRTVIRKLTVLEQQVSLVEHRDPQAHGARTASLIGRGGHDLHHAYPALPPGRQRHRRRRHHLHRYHRAGRRPGRAAGRAGRSASADRFDRRRHLLRRSRGPADALQRRLHADAWIRARGGGDRQGPPRHDPSLASRRLALSEGRVGDYPGGQVRGARPCGRRSLLPARRHGLPGGVLAAADAARRQTSGGGLHLRRCHRTTTCRGATGAAPAGTRSSDEKPVCRHGRRGGPVGALGADAAGHGQDDPGPA
jgi:two-component system CheB/CheR fusion protein